MSKLVTMSSKAHPPPLASPHSVPLNLLSKALSALVSHVKKSSSQPNTTGKRPLPLDEDTDGVPSSDVYLTITLSKVPAKSSAKPITVALPHPFRHLSSPSDPLSLRLLLIVKDDDEARRVASLQSGDPSLRCAVTDVLTLSRLRKDYERYEARRELLSQYDVFLADDRILPMLASALGKSFFASKKQPLPVRLSKRKTAGSMVSELSAAVSSAAVVIPAGTAMTVKVGTSGMTVAELADNASAVARRLTESHMTDDGDRVNAILGGGWERVRGMGVKGGGTATIPFYARTTKELNDMGAEMGLQLEDNGNEDPEQIEREALKIKKAKRGDAAEEEDAAEKPKSKLALALEQASKKEAKKEAALAPPAKEAQKEKKRKADEEPAAAAAAAAAEPAKKEKKAEAAAAAPPAKKEKKAEVVVAAAAAEPAKKEKKAEAAAAVAEPAKKEKKPEAAAASSADPPTFVAGKTYSGRKAGMCFKKGSQGMGYYKDKPFVFDAEFAAKLRQGGMRAAGGKQGGGEGALRSVGYKRGSQQNAT